MIKKLTAVLAIIIGLTGLGSGLFAADVYADTALPVLQGEAAILMDGNSGKILRSSE